MTGLFVVPRREVGEAAWDAFVDAHPSGWFWHTWGWREYGLALGGDREDLSFAVLDGGRVAAVVPLMREGDRCAYEGKPDGGWPLVAPGPGARDVQEFLWDRFRVGLPFAYRAGPLYEPCAEFSGVGIGWRSRVIDLTRTEADLHADLRKSYRHLINRGERSHVIAVGADSALEDAYESVHREAGGTRLPATYDLQDEWLARGLAYLVGARRPSGDRRAFVAFAYVIAYKGGAYYASGPSTEPSVMHAVVWRAVLEAKRRGCERFETGWQGEAADAKGRAVEFFKAGFGGADEPVYVCEGGGP